MKLTIYLLRPTVADLGQSILERHTASGSYVEIEPSADLPFPCRAWLQRNKTKNPPWLEWLSAGFDFSDLEIHNTSNSVILALEAAGRIFVATFGYGFGAIDRSIVETDFGLRVALNAVDPQALDTLNTRTLDRVTKQTRTHLNIGRPVHEFGIDPDLDWLRSVRGKASDGEIAGRVEGADSVGLNWNGGLNALGECCGRLLELYGSETYKSNFEFVDHVRPLRTTETIISTLDHRVLELLAVRDTSRLAIAHPDPPASDVEAFKIWCGRIMCHVDELDLDVVLDFLDIFRADRQEQPDIQKIWVLAMDGEGQARSDKTSLWRYMVAQIEHDDHVYVLSLGQWFRADADYLRSLQTKVAAVPDVTDELNLPGWCRGVDEATYNQQLADARGWLLLDRRLFSVGGANNKVECADLLAPDRDFIHVKLMKSSATLSHLFAQGTVSARLFRAEPEYRQRVASQFLDKYGENFDEYANPRVVYAIATEREGPLTENLFFFSLVNLVQHKQALDAMGCTMALCKIGRDATRRQVDND